MRKAKINDHWRHVFEREKPNRIKEFSLNSKNTSINKIKFEKGINAIVGRNGAGKSTLLRSMYFALSADLKDTHNIQKVVDLSDFKIISELIIDNTDKSHNIANDNLTKTGIYAHYIDSVNDALKIQNFFLNFESEDLKEILSTKENVTLKNADILEISQIVGKQYKNINFCEIEDEFEDFEVIPYFTVEDENNRSYSSENMGQGEYLIFYIWWYFVKVTEANSILFIEEPENLLFPGAQKELFHFFLKYSNIKKLSIILTTHSEYILQEIPNDHITIIRLENNLILNTKIDHDAHYLQQFGLSSTPSKYLFVEDISASKFCSQILLELAPSLLYEFTIVPIPDGGDAIIDVIKKIKGSSLSSNYIGILDKDKYEEKKSKIDGLPIFYLPGSKDPDTDLKNIAYSKINEFIKLLPTNEDLAKNALDTVRTSDCHEWSTQLSDLLKCHEHRIFESLFSLIKEEKSFKEEVSTLIDFLNSYSSIK